MKSKFGFAIAILLILILTEVSAQPSGGGPGAPTPIGLVEVLLVGGAAIGISRIKQNRKSDDAL